MSVRTELTDLIRAVARKDWDTVDQLIATLDTAGWDGGVQVIGAAFVVAVNRRFRPDYDAREVTRFVADLRSSYDHGGTLPASETEATIRAALGEPELADGVQPDVALPAQVVVLGQLLREENLSEEQIEIFVAEVRSTVERLF